MRPLVSILIPCYNAAPWVAETLESALAQTWREREIILVDDGSTDRSLEIARKFEKRGVRVISQPNSGASAARNRAIREARGDFLQFLDADDLLTPNKISEQLRLLAEAGDKCVATCRWGRFTTDATSARFVDDAVFRDFKPIEYLLEHTGKARMIHPAAWLVPRSIADDAGPWDESLTLNDDGEYFARIVLAARRVIYVDAGASLYRSGVLQSLSRRRDRRALESLVRSVKLISDHLQKADNSPEVHRALAAYWQRLVFELYPAAHDLRRHAEAEVLRFGGTKLNPDGGPWRRRLQHAIGWKATKRLHILFYRTCNLRS